MLIFKFKDNNGTCKAFNSELKKLWHLAEISFPFIPIKKLIPNASGSAITNIKVWEQVQFNLKG